MKLKFKSKAVISIMCILLLIPGTIFAHGMFLRLEEPGVLQVEYDGGGFSPRTEVTIYDEGGTELGSGLVDGEGKYHFDESLDVHTAVADDGMGHRTEYEKGVEERSIPKLPVVIGVFAVIGIVFVVFNRRSKKQEE